MNRRILVWVLWLCLLLAAGCMEPLTPEQLAQYEQYVKLRATDVAASQAIADAKATQVAAGLQIARLTAEAMAPQSVVTATTTVTPSAQITVTLALTPGQAITATAAITAGAQIADLTMTPTAVVTPTLLPTATPGWTSTSTPSPSATASPTLTPTDTPTVTPTATLPPTPTATPAPTATLAPTFTETPPPAATPTLLSPTATATALPVATPTETTSPTPAILPSAAPATALPTAQATEAITVTAAVPPPPTPTLTATPTPVAKAIVRSRNINLRGGPGTSFDVVGTAPERRALDVVGRNTDGTWWQICCVNGQPAWVSASVVTIQGDGGAAPLVAPLLPDKLSASWALRWECHAEGCPQPECLGESTAQALQVRNERWLEVKRVATWPEKCGKNEDWLVQVDRYSGQEAKTSSPPLFYVWAGANPGPETRTIELLDRTLSLWCTDTRVREAPQSNGWTALFEGNACYDRAAGLLVTMEYTKRWLYTGTSGGKTYNRQYFGDYEVYQQILTDTNMPLSGK